MAINGLRDQDRLDGASNFVIQKGRILVVLDKNRIKDYALKVVVVSVNVDPLKKYEEAQAKAKCMILDGVKDHVVPHIAKKETAREMWETLTTLYQGAFVQQKMLLENQLRQYQIQKGEEIDPFLLRLQRIGDQLTSVGSTPVPDFMVRTALNVVIEDWETFVQSILGKASLPSWEEMWAALRQEEIRTLTKKGSSDRGARVKKDDEEDATLASSPIIKRARAAEKEEKGYIQGQMVQVW